MCLGEQRGSTEKEAKIFIVQTFEEKLGEPQLTQGLVLRNKQVVPFFSGYVFRGIARSWTQRARKVKGARRKVNPWGLYSSQTPQWESFTWSSCQLYGSGERDQSEEVEGQLCPMRGALVLLCKAPTCLEPTAGCRQLNVTSLAIAELFTGPPICKSSTRPFENINMEKTFKELKSSLLV